MTRRRVLFGWAVVLAVGAIVLAVFGQYKLAGIFGAIAITQLAALVMIQRGRVAVLVLITDVCGSTQLISDRGDEWWDQSFGRFGGLVRRELVRVPPLLIKDLGDGFLAAFLLRIVPVRRVVSAAFRLDRAAEDSGLVIRTGIHIGPCLVTKHDVRGLAVHTAARIMDSAEPGQVLVSHAAAERLVGTDLELEDLGDRALKGLSRLVRVYNVSPARSSSR